MCRRTRQIVAFVIGDRSAKTCARLWWKIPAGYRRCQSFSDFWKAYGRVFFSERHQQVGKAAGEVAHMGRFYSCTSAATGTVCSEDALIFEVRPDASIGHEVVCRLLQQRTVTYLLATTQNRCLLFRQLPAQRHAQLRRPCALASGCGAHRAGEPERVILGWTGTISGCVLIKKRRVSGRLI
jgi:hypothetical protein